jgi:hypothetical protein
MSIRRLIVVLSVLAMLLAPSTVLAAKGRGGPSASAATGISCGLPESNADALVILSNYYPGYWWDHTDLTIAVQAHPRVSDAHLAAVHDAIAVWSATLEQCFDGLITLTDIGDSRLGADIVVHYNPTVRDESQSVVEARRCGAYCRRKHRRDSQSRHQ